MSNEEIAQRLETKVSMEIMKMLPKPTCSSKHQQWQWQVSEIKKKLAARLDPGSGGITITV